MDDDDDNIIIAATCLLLSCTTQVAVTMSQKRRHSTWVRSYLRRRHQESVYYSLLPDLKQHHREKFRNFLRMEYDTFEELFQLLEPAITRKSTHWRYEHHKCFLCTISFLTCHI